MVHAVHIYAFGCIDHTHPIFLPTTPTSSSYQLHPPHLLSIHTHPIFLPTTPTPLSYHPHPPHLLTNHTHSIILPTTPTPSSYQPHPPRRLLTNHSPPIRTKLQAGIEGSMSTSGTLQSRVLQQEPPQVLCELFCTWSAGANTVQAASISCMR